MTSPTAGTEMCARCDRMLSAANTNPDRLCGYCQSEIASHHPHSAKYLEWKKNGKRREIHRAAGSNGRPTHPARSYPVGPLYRKHPRSRLPEISTLPVTYLISCVKELSRREAEARQILQVLGKGKP